MLEQHIAQNSGRDRIRLLSTAPAATQHKQVYYYDQALCEGLRLYQHIAAQLYMLMPSDPL